MIQSLFTGVRHISTFIADTASRPGAQILVLAGCAGWLLHGGSLDVLAAMVSIGSFLLTQMVLNQQRRREAALHLKIDELILAISGARNEVSGLEHRTEEEIEIIRAGHEGLRAGD